MLIDAGHFRGFAADERTARFAARRGDTADDGRPDLRVELAAGEVVKKEQRLGALDYKIVDRHGNEVDPDCGVPRRLDSDLDLGADAICCGDQDRVGKACGFEVEKAAEAADLGVRPGSRSLAQQRLDQIDHAVARIDVDSSGRVASVFHGLTNGDDRPDGAMGRLLRRNHGVRKPRHPAI